MSRVQRQTKIAARSRQGIKKHCSGLQISMEDFFNEALKRLIDSYSEPHSSPIPILAVPRGTSILDVRYQQAYHDEICRLADEKNVPLSAILYSAIHNLSVTEGIFE
ncbi:hypothetical protein [Roseibium sp.]|uniref:hypothetical protein n=1 Tax=Roseibium sp. TaxID=1936156 RepID=UPI0032974173